MSYFEKRKKKKTLYFAMLIVILVFSRLIPHPPNFTPIISVAIMCGIIFETLLISLIVLIGSMLISDLIIGFSSTKIFSKPLLRLTEMLEKNVVS